jgi:hypothetical protein
MVKGSKWAGGIILPLGAKQGVEGDRWDSGVSWLWSMVSPRTFKSLKEDSELFVRVTIYYLMYRIPTVLNVERLFFDVKLQCFG